jgi:hypothetical protein
VSQADSSMEKLRDEILQCESARADLLKWKLVIAGGVGAAGLGFAGSTGLRHADLVLCVIPPAAVYVDLLCRHLTLKMLVIGTFLAHRTRDDGIPVFAAYETFAARARALDDKRPAGRGFRDWCEVLFIGRERGKAGAFDLEDWALSTSTVALSVALAFYGIGFAIVSHSFLSLAFVASGVAGLLATAVGNEQHVRRFHAIEQLGSTAEPSATTRIEARTRPG